MRWVESSGQGTMTRLLAWTLLLTTLHSPQARPYILFANRKDIRLLEITNNKARAQTNIIVKNLEDAAALDYFLEDSQVCWSEINREVIRCAKIDPYVKGKVEKVDIVTSGLIKPEGLACDWVGNKIYWTDSDTKRIEVSGLTGSEAERAVLVWSQLDLPRAISLAPSDGLMFWSDWGQYPKIESCGMNGDLATRKVLVDNDIVWPNGITLDFEARRLFWLEAKLGYIASVDWDGGRRKTIYVANNKQALPQPFAITMAAGVLFWTDWDTNGLYSYNISTDQVERLKVRGKLSPMDIRVFEPSRQPPGSSPCNTGNGGCSHLCLAAPYPPRYSCSCPTGYRLLNSTSCAEQNSALLLVAARESIIKVSLDTPDFTDQELALKSVVNSIAIDYDPVDKRVYWTDLEDDHKQSIRSARLSGDDRDERDVVTMDVDHPDGVAVDWVARNIFWTDSGTDRIEVARLDGSSRRVVISEDMDEPRSLVLDLSQGWMFWSDWGRHPRIERSWLDGSSREVVIDSQLIWPNGIALDTAAQKLYWCDAKMDRIEMSNVDGSERTVVIDHDLPHPFGFTLLDNHIYWTDWQDRSIQRAGLDGSDKTVLVSHLDDLMGAKAVLAEPPAGFTNLCAGAGCSHLCLFTPGGAVCACPTGHELTADLVTCVVPEAFLLYTRRDDIRRISIESPNSNILIPLKGVVEASALDYHRTDGRIYWSDIELKTISRAFLNGSHLEVVVEFGLDFPKGLAVDWRAGNLYWTDAGTGRIEMSLLDGSSRRVLLWQDLDSPECIVVRPGQGLLWSSWGETPLIEGAGLDGRNRVVHVSPSGRATGLTIDQASNTLYWTDQDSLTLKSTSLHRPGSPVTIHHPGGHPYAMTIYSSSLYLTDWEAHTVSRLPLPPSNSSPPVLLHSGLDYVMDLLAYQFQPPATTSPPSPCSSHSCSSLCIVVSGSATCACPSHYTLGQDGVSCHGPAAFLLFSQKNKISRLLLEPGLPGEVPDMVLPIKRARSIQAVSYDPLEEMIYWVDHGRGEQPSRQVIRRATDSGGADRIQLFDRAERFLPYDLVINPFTQTLYWTCANTNTINATRLGPELLALGPVLLGGRSEQPRLLALHPARQQLYVSLEGEFTGEGSEARLEAVSLVTGVRKVLLRTSPGAVTALTADTEDLQGHLYWADIIHKRLEAVSDSLSRRVVVSEGVVEPVGLAVLGQWLYWADRDQASLTRVDKLTGTGRQAVLTRVPRLSSLAAVPRLDTAALRKHPCFQGHGCSHFCSSLPGATTPTCSCPLGLVLATDNRTCGAPPTCEATEFTCVSGGPSGAGPACIPLQWRCDGQSECGDRSDELDCPECGPKQFRCQSSQCVPSSQLCDGTPDCDDRTDEQLCCAESEFQCAVTGECVARLKLCDGEHDCGDSSDELLPKCSVLERAGGSGASAPCCPDPSTRRLGSEAATTTTSTYLIAVFAGLISLALLALIVMYCRRRTGLRRDGGGDSESRRPLQPSLQPVTELAQCAEQVSRGLAVGAEPAAAVAGSSNGLLYDRSHVTGASSTGGTSSSGCAGAQGPPPSPATSIGTKLSRLGPSSHRSKSLGRSSKPGSSFVAGLPTGYRFYTHRAAPPCTPCSTDVADESDYAAGPLHMYSGGARHFTSRAGSTAHSRTGGYDSETYGREEDFPSELPSLLERGRYAPPPTTPLYLSDYCGEDGDSSRAPSPATERSFFLNPCLPGPPPSPVPGPLHQGGSSSSPGGE